MAQDDPTLQELIVRALTGGDRAARQSLDAAAARDPELRSFCADLEDVVGMLVGAKDWRVEAPSPELTAKVRQAVVARLPEAPPHFRKVLIEADLGRQRTQRMLLIGVALAALAAAALAVLLFTGRGPDPALKLKGMFAYEATVGGDPARDFAVLGEGSWDWDDDGLKCSEGSGAGALCLKQGFPADEAVAFRLDARVPGLDAKSSVVIFLADAAGESLPLFGNSSRPARGITLEVTRDSLVLYDADQELLESRPQSSSSASFLQVRMEHLGQRVRILVNGDRFYAGTISRAPEGPLHPGIRIVGPRKGEFRFNKIRVER